MLVRVSPAAALSRITQEAWISMKVIYIRLDFKKIHLNSVGLPENPLNSVEFLLNPLTRATSIKKIGFL